MLDLADASRKHHLHDLFGDARLEPSACPLSSRTASASTRLSGPPPQIEAVPGLGSRPHAFEPGFCRVPTFESTTSRPFGVAAQPYFFARSDDDGSADFVLARLEDVREVTGGRGVGVSAPAGSARPGGTNLQIVGNPRHIMWSRLDR